MKKTLYIFSFLPLLLSLSTTPNLALGADVVWSMPLNTGNGTLEIPVRTFFPICNRQEAATRVALYFRDKNEPTKWNLYQNNQVYLEGEFGNADKIDNKFIIYDRSCFGLGNQLAARRNTKPLSVRYFNPSGQPGCLYVDWIGKNPSATCDNLFPLSPSECHYTPSETTWDLGMLTVDELLSKRIEFNIRVTCNGSTSDEPLLANVEVEQRITDGIKLIFKDHFGRIITNNLYELLPNTSNIWTIELDGAPTKTGNVQYSTLMKITYL